MSQAVPYLVNDAAESNMDRRRTEYSNIRSVSASADFLLLRSANGKEIYIEVRETFLLMHRNVRHEFSRNRANSGLIALFLQPSSADTLFSVHLETKGDKIITAVNEYPVEQNSTAHLSLQSQF